VGPAEGLYLGSRIPPWVKNEYIVSCCQVESNSSGFKRDKKYFVGRIKLKSINNLFPVGARACKKRKTGPVLPENFCIQLQVLYKR